MQVCLRCRCVCVCVCVCVPDWGGTYRITTISNGLQPGEGEWHAAWELESREGPAAWTLDSREGPAAWSQRSAGKKGSLDETKSTAEQRSTEPQIKDRALT
jgi:hypothetical protein